MAHYKLAHCDFAAPRTELHEVLNLTGAEISINTLPAGVSVPFVHAHTHNEEIYLVEEGAGILYIDGEEIPLHAGDCFRIDPQGVRCLCAANDTPLRFICVQVRAKTLESFTATDAIIPQGAAKPGWL